MSATGNPTGTRAPDKLPVRLCISFGIGAIGTSMLLNVITTFFPVLMTTVLGQSAAIAGLLLTVSKLYDIVADIVIGQVSDRTRTRIGRRRPYLLAGMIISVLSFLMIFMPPALTGAQLIAYMTFALILYSTGYALFAIPYLAMGGEMTSNYHERTRLMSFRVFFAAIGQLLSSAGAAWLVGFAGGGTSGYAALGAGCAIVLATAMTICFIGTASAPWTEATPVLQIPRMEKLRSLFSNRPFVVLMGIKISQFFAIAVAGTTKLLFLLNVLNTGYQGLVQLTLAQNLVYALTVPLWARFAPIVGKRVAYLIATGMLGMLYLSWMFTGPGVSDADIWVRGIINGVAAAGTALMSVSMLPDVMAYDRIRSGQNREGTISAAYTISEKAAYALGPGVIGAMLATSGYIATTKGQIVVQPEQAITMLYIGASILPAALIGVSFILMLFYRLDEKELERATAAGPV